MENVVVVVVVVIVVDEVVVILGDISCHGSSNDGGSGNSSIVGSGRGVGVHWSRSVRGELVKFIPVME